MVVGAEGVSELLLVAEAAAEAGAVADAAADADVADPVTLDVAGTVPMSSSIIMLDASAALIHASSPSSYKT